MPRTTSPRRRPLQIAVAVPVLAAATVGVLAATTASATAGSPAPRHAVTAAQQTKPTVVLVHGAWADTGSWSEVMTRLTHDGYPVLALADPLRGLTSDSDYVRAQLTAIPGPVVLVAHSYGGAVITNAARGTTNVKALVYVAGYAPDEGESVQTVLPPQKYPSHLGPTSLGQVPIANAAAATGHDVDLYIKRRQFRDIFANDVPAATATAEALTQRPLAGTAFGQPSGAPAWKTIPSWDLVTLRDHAISPDGQRYMAARMHARTAYSDSGHDVMISHPADVVRIVERAATGQ